MGKITKLPLVRQILWLLNSRKSVVAIVGILGLIFAQKMGMDAETAEALSWKIVTIVGIVITAITGEDVAKHLSNGKGDGNGKTEDSDSGGDS